MHKIEFTKEQISDLFELQNGFNTRVIPEWKDRAKWGAEKQNEWALKQNTAFILEFAELIESTPWKWWKKAEVDLQNVHVEIVDMLHFLLSCYMAHNISQDIFMQDMLGENYSIKKEWQKIENLLNEETPYKFFNECFNFCTNFIYVEYMSLIFIALCKKYDIDANTLYDKYILKNKVNHNRQQKGYSTETKDLNDCKHI